VKKLVIVGSGASAVHFALSVLEKGYQVTMVDVGKRNSVGMEPQYSFTELKTKVNDPVRYLLGEGYEGVVFPGTKGEYYGFPPSKGYIFSTPESFDFDATGFEPLFSFAQGGLAEAWTGGVYPLNDQDLREFPFGYVDLEPYYGEVAERIGITGVKDDLSRFFPVHRSLTEPLDLDVHARGLLAAYERKKASLNNKLRCHVGQSRIAVLRHPKGKRKECTYLGRCLWGCPSGAFYTPRLTLQDCHTYPNFRYVPNTYVTHFAYTTSGQIRSIVGQSPNHSTRHEFFGDVFVLAAGTLSSSAIFLRSILKQEREEVRLTGLMDNRQILIPFVNPKMIGEEHNASRYQYHQLAMGIESENPEEYVHGQITTLKSALTHPIIGKLPFDLTTSISVFKNVRAGLGIVNVNLHDRRRDDNYVTVEAKNGPGHSWLRMKYSAAGGEEKRIRTVVRTVRKLLWKLGCIVPPGMIHIRPMGASVHYAGTLPMSRERMPYRVSENCKSYNFPNLYVVDGATFPFLPAKNLTFTLMANAIRVAEREF